MKLQTEIAMNGGINNSDNNNKVMVFLVRLSGYVDDMEATNNIEGSKVLRREVSIFLNSVSGSGMDYELLINEIKVVLARINDIIEKKNGNNGELDEYLNILTEDIELKRKEQIKNMKNNNNKNANISVNELKLIIRECIEEVMSEVSVDDFNDYEPIEADDATDAAGSAIDDLNDTVDNLIRIVNSEVGDWDKAYDRLRDIYDRLGKGLNNPRLTNQERNKLEHEYEGIMGKIWGVIGGGGSAEKFYVNEQKNKNKKK